MGDTRAAAQSPIMEVLALRRPPWVLLLRRPLSLGGREAAFLGWFGPIGVAALYYLVHAEHQGVSDPVLWSAGTLVIAASTIVHGATAMPFREWYRRAAASRDADAASSPPSERG